MLDRRVGVNGESGPHPERLADPLPLRGRQEEGLEAAEVLRALDGKVTGLDLVAHLEEQRALPASAVRHAVAADERLQRILAERGSKISARRLWENRSMFDTHAVARSLTAADFTPAQADALTDALRSAAEQGDHVTSDQFKAGQAELRAEIASLDTRLSTQIAEVRTEIASLDTRLSTQIAEVRTEIASLDTRLSTDIAGVRTEISNLETRLIRWTVGTVIATATLTVGILRLLGMTASP